MAKNLRRACFVMLSLFAAVSYAQENKKHEDYLGRLLQGQIENMEKQVLEVAEAMPADKFDFKPEQAGFEGVRSFAQQLKHVGAANFAFAAAVDPHQEKPPDELVAAGPSTITSKDAIIAYVRKSFEAAKAASLTITEKNYADQAMNPFGKRLMSRFGLICLVVNHSSDHYAQLELYLRMNRIVPPASRPLK
jgi:uncharacterized damage-inducible protein DinB